MAALQAGLPETIRLLCLDVTPEVDTPAVFMAVARQVDAHWLQACGAPALFTAYHVDALDPVEIPTAQGRVVSEGGVPSNSQMRQLMSRVEP